MLDLKGKTAVITGGSQGLGKAIAIEFVRYGANVVIADILNDIGQAAVREIEAVGGACMYHHCDVTKRANLETLMNAAVSRFGRLDIVVANAGLAVPSHALDLEEDEFERVIGVNLKGVYLTGQVAARIMLGQDPDENGNRGVIINMSSVNATSVLPEAASYVMSKGGVNQWTKALAIKVAPDGIRVNAIGPGTFATEMNSVQTQDPDRFRALMSRTPIGRPGTPDEIGKIALFLASDLSSYIIGQTIYADGGRMALNVTVPVTP